jgi:hypothetical protein
MRIPKKIQIGGITFGVRWVDDLAKKENSIGIAKIEGTEILIHKDKNDKRKLSKDYKCATFLHEVLHHIFHMLSINIKNEDAVVDMMANLLLQVIKQVEGK